MVPRIARRRPAAEAAPGDQRRGQARREILVFPVGPGLRLRQVPVGPDADAGDQQDCDKDRPERSSLARRIRRRHMRRWCKGGGVGGDARLAGPRGGVTRGPVGDVWKRLFSPWLSTGNSILVPIHLTFSWRRQALTARRYAKFIRLCRGGTCHQCEDASPAASMRGGGNTLGRSRPGGGLRRNGRHESAVPAALRARHIDGVVGLRLGRERLDRELGCGQ